MEIHIGNIIIEAIEGNIVEQPDMTAVVNAANTELQPGGGVAGAIHRAAGPGLEEECRPLAPIRTGEAVITGAHNLQNKYVIHCLGPIFGIHQPEDELLADCYRNALRLADEKKIGSIAFPAISTGAFGYPLKEATRVVINTVTNEIPHLDYIRTIRFVLIDNIDYKEYEEQLSLV